MRVLASVYACSPYDGSERAVGWNWLKELSKYHEITALICHVYKADIEDYLLKNPHVMENVRFVYIDVPHTSWHKSYRMERLYYILWQRWAVKIAKDIVLKERFDLVHHITYVTCILPTYMYKLGIPFLYGPVAGGENIPSIIDYPMSKKNKIFELIRLAAQIFFRLTPSFHKAMKKAALIITVTEETKKIIPQKYHSKTEIFQSIGLKQDFFYPEPEVKPDRRTRYLMIGRMLYLKGFELGILAFIKALKDGGDGELIIIGDTEDNPSYEMYCKNLKKMCGKYLNERIRFVAKVDHSEMKSFYDTCDVLINCSLRDSGCFVVMEGMSRALPVIVINTGGPKVNTAEDFAIRIEPALMSQMIEKMADAIVELGTDKDKRETMGRAARKYAYNVFLLEKRVKRMNEYYKQTVFKGEAMKNA